MGSVEGVALMEGWLLMVRKPCLLTCARLWVSRDVSRAKSSSFHGIVLTWWGTLITQECHWDLPHVIITIIILANSTAIVLYSTPIALHASLCKFQWLVHHDLDDYSTGLNACTSKTPALSHLDSILVLFPDNVALKHIEHVLFRVQLLSPHCTQSLRLVPTPQIKQVIVSQLSESRRWRIAPATIREIVLF